VHGRERVVGRCRYRIEAGDLVAGELTPIVADADLPPRDVAAEEILFE
jgi:hypothetical protein